MTDQVCKILDCYRRENPGVLTNLARILNHGRLGGTGRMIILPVDQGFEHGQRAVFRQILPLTIRPTISDLPLTPASTLMLLCLDFSKQEPLTSQAKTR